VENKLKLCQLFKRYFCRYYWLYQQYDCFIQLA